MIRILQPVETEKPKVRRDRKQHFVGDVTGKSNTMLFIVGRSSGWCSKQDASSAQIFAGQSAEMARDFE
jgi:hypothetical protein